MIPGEQQAAASRSQEALRAANLYYVQNLTMAAIAHEMGVSRSSVSRLLAHARDRGIVEITLHSPSEARNLVERRVAEAFGIAVHVVPTTAAVTEFERLERTAVSAARIVAAMVEAGTTIGIAWGATLSAVARHLPSRPARDSRVVQMNGAANPRTTGIPYASEILGRFGDAFSAEVHHFPVPALFDDAATKEAMWRERSVRSVLRVQSQVGLFVFGLGAPRAEVPSHVYAGDYLSDADRRSFEADRIVGDCATVFYRLDGSSDGIELNRRSSGPSLESVRRIARRVCVVSSLSKLDSLRGALAARLVTDLIVEENLAERLLAVAHDVTRRGADARIPT